MNDVQIRWHFSNKARVMDEDLRKKARAACALGEERFPEAQLRPEDERWWRRLWAGIVGASDGENAYLLSLVLGVRDTDRILHEGILMGDRVIRARQQLRAAVAVFGMEARVAQAVKPERDGR